MAGLTSSKLKTFSLEGKSLKLNNEADIAPHVSPLEEQDDVEQILLNGNTIGIDAAKGLAKILQTKKNLQVANFGDIFTGRMLSEIPQALDALLQALLQLPKLHTVIIRDNAFGLNTVAPLISFLSSHTPLQHLDLLNTGIGADAGGMIADALTELGKKKKALRSEGKEVANLETFICGRSRLGDKTEKGDGSMATWARAFAENNGIKRVEMIQNGMRPEGVANLIKNGLAHAASLEILDLQDNTFTQEGSKTLSGGAKALSDAVGNWTELRELTLGDAYLTKRGAAGFGKALQEGKNKKLKSLRLQYNGITAESLKHIVDAVSHLPALQRVELNGNIFEEEDESIEKLKELLDERREEAGADAGDDWGVDELDELEDEEDDEDDDDDEEEEDEEDAKAVEDKAAHVVEAADKTEAQNVAQDKDQKVDDLADLLGKTQIK